MAQNYPPARCPRNARSNAPRSRSLGDQNRQGIQCGRALDELQREVEEQLRNCDHILNQGGACPAFRNRGGITNRGGPNMQNRFNRNLPTACAADIEENRVEGNEGFPCPRRVRCFPDPDPQQTPPGRVIVRRLQAPDNIVERRNVHSFDAGQLQLSGSYEPALPNLGRMPRPGRQPVSPNLGTSLPIGVLEGRQQETPRPARQPVSPNLAGGLPFPIGAPDAQVSRTHEAFEGRRKESPRPAHQPVSPNLAGGLPFPIGAPDAQVSRTHEAFEGRRKESPRPAHQPVSPNLAGGLPIGALGGRQQQMPRPGRQPVAPNVAGNLAIGPPNVAGNLAIGAPENRPQEMPLANRLPPTHQPFAPKLGTSLPVYPDGMGQQPLSHSLPPWPPKGLAEWLQPIQPQGAVQAEAANAPQIVETAGQAHHGHHDGPAEPTGRNKETAALQHLSQFKKTPSYMGCEAETGLEFLHVCRRPPCPKVGATVPELPTKPCLEEGKLKDLIRCEGRDVESALYLVSDERKTYKKPCPKQQKAQSIVKEIVHGRPTQSCVKDYPLEHPDPDDISPEVAAAMVFCQEKGIDLAGCPQNAINYLFPEKPNPSLPEKIGPENVSVVDPQQQQQQEMIEQSATVPAEGLSDSAYTRRMRARGEEMGPQKSYNVDGNIDQTKRQYVLVAQKPQRVNKAQFRGGASPSWFPGFLSAFPDEDGGLKLVHSPSKVFHKAWIHSKPSNIPSGDVIVLD